MDEFAHERVVVKQVRMGGGVAERGVCLQGVSPEAEFVTYGHESYELMRLVFHKAHGVLAVIPAVIVLHHEVIGVGVILLAIRAVTYLKGEQVLMLRKGVGGADSEFVARHIAPEKGTEIGVDRGAVVLESA